MTVTYTAEVASCKKFGCFIKLLARWRGSIYKIIWMDLLLFLALYYCINFIYFRLLENESKRTFESIVYYCANHTSLIPLSFVLGFYVNLVMTRWWEQYITIPWPDSIAVFVSAHVHGQDEGSRLMRRTVMRYVCVCLTIVFTMISPCVKKRFPKLQNLVEAGLLLENEKQIIEAMDKSFPNYPKHWMPIVWAASIITRARKEGRIRDDFAVKTIIDELNHFRGRCGTLMYYDFISIPLVYTQVVTIAVYSFFVCSLLAHQWVEHKKDTAEALDFYSPIFITLQFFFYMGWLKVAETLINPFGEDDDDFEVNWMIDRNLQVSYLIVDEMHHEHPELVRDQYWDEVYPSELPYESEVKREQPPEPSTAKYDLDSLPKQAASRITFLTNGKADSSIPNTLSRRSQMFNEAFQRFLNYSEPDTTSSINNKENKNSFQSISDIENIEHITSYTAYSDQTEFVSQLDNEEAKDTCALEVIKEDGEEVFGSAEDETLHADVEEGEEEVDEEEEMSQDETASEHESDSDSDTFERLRLERQQQRLQRMNDYLERHFGRNFRIITQFSDTNFKLSNKPALIKEDNEVDPLNAGENDENLLTPKISANFIRSDLQSQTSLFEEKLLTPKLSKAQLTTTFGTDFSLPNDNKNIESSNEISAINSTTTFKEKFVAFQQASQGSTVAIKDHVASNSNLLKHQTQLSNDTEFAEQQKNQSIFISELLEQGNASISSFINPNLTQRGSHTSAAPDKQTLLETLADEEESIATLAQPAVDEKELTPLKSPSTATTREYRLEIEESEDENNYE